MKWPASVLVVALALSVGREASAHPEPAAAQQAFESARTLERAGKVEDAFLAYAAIPGAQHAAVRIAAAVSLLVLGERDVEPAIVGWLGSSAAEEARETLRHLERVRDGRDLTFARAALQPLADEPGGLAKRLLARIPR